MARNDETDMPEEPTEEDCCHNDCTPCVFDIYRAQLKLWEQKREDNIPLRCDVLSQTRFKSFVLRNIIPLTKDTNMYTFQPAIDGNAEIAGFLSYKAGQHVILRLKSSKEKSEIVTRAYTVVTQQRARKNCAFQVLIKLYNNGVMSNYIKTLQPGDITYWRGPYGDFIYEPNKYSNLLMICMGTGIAPMYTIIQEIVNNEDDETKVMLMFGCRNSYDIILREELYSLGSYWNFKYSCYLSEGSPISEKKFSENFINGKISCEYIKSCIKYPVENLLVLVCGNPSFTDEVFNSLISCEVPRTNIHIF